MLNVTTRPHLAEFKLLGSTEHQKFRGLTFWKAIFSGFSRHLHASLARHKRTAAKIEEKGSKKSRGPRCHKDYQLEALAQCIPPPRHLLLVPPSGESVCAAELCLLTTFRISKKWRIRKTIPVSRQRSGSPLKFNRLFVGPLPAFPENFMQICLEVLAQSC